MKTKHLALIGCFLGTILQLHSQGYIVPNGVIDGGIGALGYQTRVIQNPANGDIGVFGFTPQGGDTFSFSSTVDQGVRVFFVESDDPISLQPIVAQSYPELTYPNTYVLTSGNPFYVGIFTGPSFAQNGIYDDPLFGWAHLVNNAGVIELLDGALEYGGAGIYAGTQTIIPEPSTFPLAALGTLLFGFRRWRNSAR